MAVSWTSRKHNCRYKKSVEQIKINPKSKKEIFIYTKKYLEDLGVDTSKIKSINDVIKKPPFDDNFYKKIKDKYNLEHEEDIIWMKFTKKGHLGVVATSNDINFDIPKDSSDFFKKNEKGDWLYNFSGVIIKYLNQEWNENYVFVFPIPNISSLEYSRHKLEKLVGDNLIDLKTPILDYFSHKLL